MSSDLRQVRHLRLKAPSQASVQHAVHQLEDALRTASLPGGSRIVIVRRLALGRIAAGAPSQSFALRLEAALQAQASRLVHGPLADDSAEAVWFHDALEAHVSLALRLATGHAASEWFWPQALPVFVATATPQANIARLLRSLASLPEAAAALPAFAAQLEAAGARRLLLQALQAAGNSRWPQQPGALPMPADVQKQAQGAGVRMPKAPMPSRPAPMTLTAAEQLLRRWLRSAPALPRRALPGEQEAMPGEALADTPLKPSGGRRAADLASQQPRLPGLHGLPGTGDAAKPSALSALDPSHPRLVKNVANNSFTQATAAGGLLFLLPLLTGLGYATWLAEAPRWQGQALPQAIFALLLTRLDVAPDDPAWALTLAPRSSRNPRQFLAPEVWTRLLKLEAPHYSDHQPRLVDGSGRLTLAAWMSPTAPASTRRFWLPENLALPPAAPARSADAPQPMRMIAAQAWLTACLRHLRRRCGMGLGDLVLRKAQLGLTTTHADMFLPLSAVDIRIRRAGLDLDPGWLPWLGRVVRFHYGESPAP